jgi:hypothetical protein
MSSFNERLAFQKTVYLLQQLGITLGNSYGWYLRGPYSPDTASDGFYLEKIQDQLSGLPELDANEKRATNKFTDMLSEAQVLLSKDDVYCLELLASLHFVLNYGYPKPTTKELAISQLTLQKTKFTKHDGEVALELLEKYGLAG